MKTTKLLLLLLFLQVFNLSIMAGTYDIRKFGAKGNGKTLNTKAINQAIETCAQNGGGTVIIPAGVFLTGTIHLKSNVNILIEKNGVLKGTSDIEAYQSYIPGKNLGKYDSGTEETSDNMNSASDKNWTKTLILGTGIENVSISGEGIIDGDHVFNPAGEENMRGPHTIILAESKNITLSGISINKSANYAFLAYEIENVMFNNMTYNEGWDGIHIRGGKNIIIRNCDFYTGDDAIAGGYWENMTITDCYINSSCDGIRIIMPAKELTISHCKFKGPGKYSHRTSKELHRTNMLSAILFQPGGWGDAPGNSEKIHFHDLEMDNLDNPFMFVLSEGNCANNILVENVKATHLNYAALSMESWKGGSYSDVIFRNVSLDYIGSDKVEKLNTPVKNPPANARDLPCWGGLFRNVNNLLLENVSFQYSGKEIRPAFYFNNVYNTIFKNVEYKEAPNVNPFILTETGKIMVQGAR